MASTRGEVGQMSQFTFSHVDTKRRVSFFHRQRLSSSMSGDSKLLEIRTSANLAWTIKRGADGFLQRKHNCERGDWSRRLFFQIISCLGLAGRLLMSTCQLLMNAGGSGLLLFAPLQSFLGEVHNGTWWFFLSSLDTLKDFSHTHSVYVDPVFGMYNFEVPSVSWSYASTDCLILVTGWKEELLSLLCFRL